MQETPPRVVPRDGQQHKQIIAIDRSSYPTPPIAALSNCHVGGREFKSRTSRHETPGHRPILGGDFSFSGCPLTPCIENELRQLGAKPAKIDPAREKGIPIMAVADLLEVLER